VSITMTSFVTGNPFMHRLHIKVLLALRNLTLHKFRVLLNLLGLIFGVSSVIAMLAITEGARLDTQRQFAALGAKNIIIRSVQPDDDVDPSSQQTYDTNTLNFGLTDADLGRIMSTVPTVLTATPLREHRKKDGNASDDRIELAQITVTIDSMENVKSAAVLLDRMLGQSHPDHDYSITVPLELLRQAETTERNYHVVLGSIVSISLLAGGIGIMNIMLATVSARTREIGIRRALGARRRDIIEQFLIEATVISACGGLIGVMVGMAIPPLYSQLSGIPVMIRPWSPIIAFLIAVSIGVIFGVYPAYRAAMFEPVDALRAE
jgi:ABC-type antimicrobial peptide transport system permease subunit